VIDGDLFYPILQEVPVEEQRSLIELLRKVGVAVYSDNKIHRLAPPGEQASFLPRQIETSHFYCSFDGLFDEVAVVDPYYGHLQLFYCPGCKRVSAAVTASTHLQNCNCGILSRVKKEALVSAQKEGFLIISGDEVPGGWPTLPVGRERVLPQWLKNVFLTLRVAVVSRRRVVADTYKLEISKFSL